MGNFVFPLNLKISTESIRPFIWNRQCRIAFFVFLWTTTFNFLPWSHWILYFYFLVSQSRTPPKAEPRCGAFIVVGT